jgi:hypothetical protein
MHMVHRCTVHVFVELQHEPKVCSIRDEIEGDSNSVTLDAIIIN